VLLVPGGYTHVELGWEVQGLASFLRRLARFSRLILFDKRGMGRDLVAGSGLRFESLGPRALRGVDGSWELFAAV
jgi:hypothetical protein